MTNIAAPGPNRDDYALLLARVFMASLFLFSGIEKVYDPGGAAAFAASGGIPFASVLMPFAIAFELAAGLALVLGWRVREAAIALTVWLGVLGPLFHQFWHAPPAIWQMMIDDFFHHFVMIGGMIYVAVFGPGRIALRPHR